MKRFYYTRCVKCGKKQKRRRRCLHCGANPSGFVRIRRQNLKHSLAAGSIGAIYGCRIITSADLRAIPKYGHPR